MINVAFVCLGNICRSPMAELIFKKLTADSGLSSSFAITSFGTSDCEEGSPIYPPAKRTLEKYGVEGNHIAKQLSLKDVINNDYILVMDENNYSSVVRLTGGKFNEKIFRLCAFTSRPRDVADPWYTCNFEIAYRDILDGCQCFLEYLIKENKDALSYDKRH